MQYTRPNVQFVSYYREHRVATLSLRPTASLTCTCYGVNPYKNNVVYIIKLIIKIPQYFYFK